MDDNQQDICRVCRSEGLQERPLYHPCLCIGSIKFIHQECLVQWLKYSRKEYCELCNHRFSFTPIYSPDMPKRLPIKDILSGLVTSVGTAIRFWFHYTLVAFAWLGVVPLTACRIYRCLFTGSVTSILTLPLDIFSTDNLLTDSFHGCFVVTLTLCAFISLVWLREQILHGGGPDWLEQDNAVQEPNNNIGEGVAANLNAGAAPVVQPVVNQEEGVEGVNNGDQNAAQDDINWNPIEWDRAAEELTWERLLGLDGSLVFLEHVFWVVSLNTLFILVFGFCPYHIGNFAIMGFQLKDNLTTSHFDGLLIALFGYILIGVWLVLLHGLASLAKFKRMKRIVGLSYIVVKVSLLFVIEIGVFPLICGWWLDVCSLSLFDATLKDRETSFRIAPGTSMFIHWLVGMVYVFYFASFVLLLREVLRPGVLWFLRNLNDPDFNPIQEMIHLPVLRHIRRFLASMVIFGTTVLIMLWLPIHLIKLIWSSFLPFNVILSSEIPVSELSLELLLLHVILPALLEQGHTRSWLKAVIRSWCIIASWLLDLSSYLLGDAQQEAQAVNAEDEPARDVEEELLEPVVEEPFLEPAADIQQELELRPEVPVLEPATAPPGFQPYQRPTMFPLRVFGLIFLMCVSLLATSLVTLTLPVYIGRHLLSVWMGDGRIHELYTAACGLYTCWVATRCITLVLSWFPLGWAAILSKLRHWTIIAAKTGFALVILLGVIPLMLGLLFELVVIIPLRVPLNQTPVLFIWQDWALGVLHTKILCGLAMMGPNWWLKRVIEQIYQGGLRNMNLQLILVDLAIPSIIVLGLALSVPYVIACSLVPCFGTTTATHIVVLRRIYPGILVAVGLGALAIFQIKQFWKLYEHIKNDKYLVGRRLVNYDHRPRHPSNPIPTQATAS